MLEQTTKPSIFVPPLNFSIIQDGIFRSGYPNKKNFEFLKKLELKSIVYVCEGVSLFAHCCNVLTDDYSTENLDFFTMQNIQVFQFRISGNKEPFVEVQLFLDDSRHC